MPLIGIVIDFSFIRNGKNNHEFWKEFEKSGHSGMPGVSISNSTLQ